MGLNVYSSDFNATSFNWWFFTLTNSNCEKLEKIGTLGLLEKSHRNA